MSPLVLSRRQALAWRASPLLPFFAASGLVSLSALGASYTFDNLGLAVPDRQTTGVFDSRTLADPGTVNSVKVSLSLTGEPGFNGDLYAYLQHGTGFSVLLNRVGREAAHLGGYDDNGFDVTFSDSAAADIHSYRVTLNGDPLVPVDPDYLAPLTGTWQPSGRNFSPFDVLDSTPRTALLDSFAGLPVSGEWNLFVADLASGATFRLDSWGLEIDALVGPRISDSPWSGAATLLGIFGGLGYWRRRGR